MSRAEKVVILERVQTPTQLRRAVEKAGMPAMLLLGPLERPDQPKMHIRNGDELTDDAIQMALEIACDYGVGGALVGRPVTS